MDNIKGVCDGVYLGLDLGTSALKAVLVNDAAQVVEEAAAPLTVDRPYATWAEQSPGCWVGAARRAIGALPKDLRARVQAVGLAGQMHGAVLLGADDQPLRPAILWNDGRSAAQCEALEARVPVRAITGNMAMPGFTAPKVLWVAEHEPDTFAAIRHVLLPKDHLRLWLTGVHATDLSDASGTLWLDVGRRRWSDELVAALGLQPSQLPSLHEGPQVTGQLRATVAADLGLTVGLPVMAGAGDNAAAAVALGVVDPGDAFLSLGTSGVLFAVTPGFRPAPDRAAHAFCHALPERWHQMAVILSAAASLDWMAGLTGTDVASALALADEVEPFTSSEQFLPHLSGERTPYNDPGSTGVLAGLTASTTRGRLVEAVLEGVAFAMADGLDVLTEAGASVERITMVGGGARSNRWCRLLASALDRPLLRPVGPALGPAVGAARLARIGMTGEPVQLACQPPAVTDRFDPDPDLVARAAIKRASFAQLYPAHRRMRTEP